MNQNFFINLKQTDFRRPTVPWNQLPYGRELTEVVLFLILTFAESTIRKSRASTLDATACTIRELVLYKGSYISRLYGMLILNMLYVQGS